jgi:NurA domain-containing protein
MRTDEQVHGVTPEAVSAEIQRRPHVFLRLAENALTVAESLRDNYFRNTAKFIASQREWPVIDVYSAEGLEWEGLRGEVVTFIDGGVGQVQVVSQVPILLRVGSYQVKTGERNLAEREQFGYYPLILGDLDGGSKQRKDFIDIVRITAELLGGLAALKRRPDLRVLMFHGPLVYLVGNYAGHTPFTESDIDLFLQNYAADPEQARVLKERFLEEAGSHLYPQMIDEDPQETRRVMKKLIREKLFEPVAWMAFLYRQLIGEASRRTPVPLIAGVVERGDLRQFSERVLLRKWFEHLEDIQELDYFNRHYGRTDLTNPAALLDKLGYTDSLLLSMLLEPGQYSERWEMGKYEGLRDGNVVLNGETERTRFSWRPLRPPSPLGFPSVSGCYVCISETTEPVRVEVFSDLGTDQIDEVARRVLLYASLLPGYGFPVGLDIVDKYAKVPTWLTSAYAKLIRHHLNVSLQLGELSDKEMRQILVQAIYMTHRDWVFRPQI